MLIILLQKQPVSFPFCFFYRFLHVTFFYKKKRKNQLIIVFKYCPCWMRTNAYTKSSSLLVFVVALACIQYNQNGNRGWINSELLTLLTRIFCVYTDGSRVLPRLIVIFIIVRHIVSHSRIQFTFIIYDPCDVPSLFSIQ
jgi:hypothetical protein